MHMLDLLVLLCYFLLMVAIGVYCSLRIKAQEDYFLGGRSFGKLLQTFAAFGLLVSGTVACGFSRWVTGM